MRGARGHNVERTRWQVERRSASVLLLTVHGTQVTDLDHVFLKLSGREHTHDKLGRPCLCQYSTALRIMEGSEI